MAEWREGGWLQAVKFWTEKLGFRVISEENNGQGMRWSEIAPIKGAETSIILHNKEFAAKMSPGLNRGTPSLLFFTENPDELHRDFSNVTELFHEQFGRSCQHDRQLRLRLRGGARKDGVEERRQDSL